MEAAIAIDRAALRIAVPPDFDAGPLRRRLEDGQQRAFEAGLGRLSGPDEIVLMRRLSLRLRLSRRAARNADFDPVARAWTRALSTGLSSVAAGQVDAGTEVCIGPEVVRFPDAAAAVGPVLDAIALGAAPWWLSPALAELRTWAERHGLESSASDDPALGRLLRLCTELDPETTLRTIKPLATGAAAVSFARLPAATCTAIARSLFTTVAQGTDPTMDTPQRVSRQSLAVALAAHSPALATLAGALEEGPLLVLATAAANVPASSAGPTPDSPAANRLRTLVAGHLMAVPVSPQKSDAPPRAGAAGTVPTGHVGARPTDTAQAAPPRGSIATEASEVSLGGLLFLIGSGLRSQAVPRGLSEAEALLALGRRRIWADAAARDTVPALTEAPLLAVLGARPAPTTDQTNRDLVFGEDRPEARGWVDEVEGHLAALLPDGPLSWPWLLRRTGRLRLSDSHAILELPQASADLSLRAGGWDIDPGWLPALGRVIRFTYVEDLTR